MWVIPFSFRTCAMLGQKSSQSKTFARCVVVTGPEAPERAVKKWHLAEDHIDQLPEVLGRTAPRWTRAPAWQRKLLTRHVAGRLSLEEFRLTPASPDFVANQCPQILISVTPINLKILPPKDPDKSSGTPST